MALFSKLFGGKSGSKVDAEPVVYEGYRIFGEPVKEGSSYRLAARIEMDTESGMKTHDVIRADTFGSLEEATEWSVAKCKQLIDQMGERLFG